MKSGFIFLSTLLLTSILVLVNSSAVSAETDEGILSASGSASASGDSGEVAAASGNNRFVVWYDYTPGNYDIFFRRSTDNGANWQPTVNLSTNPGPSYVPQIAVSGANVYVVWSQQTTDGSLADIYVRKSTDNGATWKSIVNISNNAGDSTSPQIAVSGSNVYVTWYDQTPGKADIFLRRSADNGSTWKAVKNLSSNAGFSYLVAVG